MVKINGKITPKNTNLKGIVTSGKNQTSDYNLLMNKPLIEGVEIVGNKTFEDFGFQEVSNQQILNLFK